MILSLAGVARRKANRERVVAPIRLDWEAPLAAFLACQPCVKILRWQKKFRACPTFFCARRALFLAQMVVIRRYNLSCGYCSEYDKFSDPVSAEVLEKRLLKLKELGTFSISPTGGDAPCY